MITKEKMNEIYKKTKTPYKRGAIVKFEDSLCDSPTIFKFNRRWYMYFVRIDKNVRSSGYETHMASSDDLLNWKYEGKILRRSDAAVWDSKQRGGYAAFVDNAFGGTNEIQMVNDKYYMSYLGGCLDGYETDPLSMGLAYSQDPTDVDAFSTFKEPILSPLDSDAREFEKITLFKSFMFIDDDMTLGHKYVNAYNARDEKNAERIYLAVSDDGESWTRYGGKPIIDEIDKIDNLIISGDPQIVKIDGLYVMFYFRYAAGKGAYNTFACSEDLTDWTVWEGEPLIKPEYEWENVHAHKSYVIKDGNIVYHFYCACNDKKERFIALATSEEI